MQGNPRLPAQGGPCVQTISTRPVRAVILTSVVPFRLILAGSVSATFQYSDERVRRGLSYYAYQARGSGDPQLSETGSSEPREIYATGAAFNAQGLRTAPVSPCFMSSVWPS